MKLVKKQIRTMISFDLSDEELRLIEQRARQEGVNRSQYIKSAIFMEFLMSGDLECYRFLGRRTVDAVTEVYADRIAELHKKFDRLKLA